MPLLPVFWSFSTTVSHSRCCLSNDSANERGDRKPLVGRGRVGDFADCFGFAPCLCEVVGSKADFSANRWTLNNESASEPGEKNH